MSLKRFFWAILLVCVNVAIGPRIATALVCGQSEGIPNFTASIEPNTAPSPPAEPYSLSSLDLYRAKLEIFRSNSLEGYNRKLIAYSATLKRLDQNFRKAVSKGACTSTEYEALKEQLDKELTKIGSDYLEPYRQGMTSYTEYMQWCKLEIAHKRFAADELRQPLGGYRTAGDALAALDKSND